MKNDNFYPNRNMPIILKKLIDSKFKIKYSYFIALYLVSIVAFISYIYDKIYIQFNLENIYNYLLVISLITLCYLIITLLITNILIKYIK